MSVSNRLSAALLAASTLALSGCLSLSAEPPESLLTLSASSAVPSGAVTSGTGATALRIMEPETPQKLAVTRVPVQVDATEIAYLKDAVWVEKPSRLFRRLLAETIRARSSRMVIDSDDPALLATSQLRGTLREFGYDAATGSVVVRFDAIRDGASGSVETRRFERIIPGVAAEAAPVGAALNRAANEVAVQVADWMAG